MNSGIKALLVHCAKCIGKIRIFFVLSNFLFHHFDLKCQNIAKHPPKTFPYSSQNYPVFPCEEIDFIPINQTTNFFTTQSSQKSWLYFPNIKTQQTSKHPTFFRLMKWNSFHSRLLHYILARDRHLHPWELDTPSV